MSDVDRRSFLTRVAGGVAAAALLPDLGLAREPKPNAGLRVALVGVGRHGRSILAEIQKIAGAEVVAICDVDERRLASGLRRTAGAKGYASLDELLKDATTFDCIIVATPTHTHRHVGIRAIESGKHVYVEAPLAHTKEDCAALARAARGGGGAGGVVAAGLLARTDPVYQLARTFFRSDSVRDLVMMRAQHHKKTSWRAPADDPQRNKLLNWRLDPDVSTGLAGEWATHQFDVFTWYREQYPAWVRGGGSVRLHDDGRAIPDTIHCELGWADGAVLQYSATLANSYQGRFELLAGTNAAIRLAWTHGWMFKEADAPTQGWEVYANRQQFHDEEGITLIADATKLASQGKLAEGVGLPHDPLYYGLADWLGAIGEGAEGGAGGAGGVPATSLDEAARVSVVGIAAHQAVMTGQRVDVDLSGL